MDIKSSKRGALEVVILIVVFVVTFAFLLNGFLQERNVAKQKQLSLELRMLRNGIALYTVMEQKKPDNLVKLCRSKYLLPGDSKKQGFIDLASIRVNEKGEIIDPFGNPYSYDKEKPWVASTTKEYSLW